MTGRRLARRFAERAMRRGLERGFRRVVWAAGALRPPPGPFLLYANHHSFYDGYLLWLLAVRTLGRPAVLWMEEWDRVPLFGPVGALPFPADDAARRAATARETARRLRAPAADGGTAFLYFPEGALRAPDAGLGAFPPDRVARAARLGSEGMPAWPVGIRVTWWGEDRPTALLGAAPPHVPDGTERARLQAVLDALHGVPPRTGRVLLEGAASPAERWNLRRLAPLFRRWTF